MALNPHVKAGDVVIKRGDTKGMWAAIPITKHFVRTGAKSQTVCPHGCLRDVGDVSQDDSGSVYSIDVVSVYSAAGMKSTSRMPTENE